MRNQAAISETVDTESVLHESRHQVLETNEKYVVVFKHIRSLNRLKRQFNSEVELD